MDPQNASPTPNQIPSPALTPPPATAEPVVEPVPSTWPTGSFGLYKHSKAAIMLNIRPLIGLYVANIVISIILQIIFNKPANPGRVLGEIISLVIGIAIIHLILAGIRHTKLSIGEALSHVKPMMAVNYFLSSILVVALLGFSLLLFIVPFFFVLPRLILAPYILVDRNLGPLEAIKQSWALTKGHSRKIWGIIGANLVMALLVITIIGIPFALYFLLMYSAAFPIAYLFLAKQPAAPATPTA